MKTKAIVHLLFASIVIFGFAGCATESHQTITPETVNSAGTPYSGVKSTLMVGKFNNQSPYMNGIFSDGNDMLGG
jgi:curli biogenesis system outer membrane secretion channel CsgG